MCSSKRTAVGEVLIPSPADGIPVLRYHVENTRKLSRTEAVGDRELGLKPEFSVASAALDVAFTR